MIRTDVINALADRYKYKTYLEIGVADKDLNFNKIGCPFKLCVDPNESANADYIMISDTFFKQNSKIFDIIFIDALHLDEQLQKDIDNAFRCLSFGGTIVCHDTLPETKDAQRHIDISKFKSVEEFREHTREHPGPWNGTCWKTIAKLNATRDDIIIYTIKTLDAGVTIIREGYQEKKPLDVKINYYMSDDLTWEYYINNRNDILNCLTVEEFEIILKAGI